MSNENRWYRVTEKIPPLAKYAPDQSELWSGYVWCLIDGIDGPIPGYYEVNMFGHAGFHVDGDAAGETVTHWASMAPAPKPWPEGAS